MCRMQYVLATVALFMGLAHSWEIAYAEGDRLEFYSYGGLIDTVRFNTQNLTGAALAYDEVHNILLYVDKQSDNDAICGYNISSVEYNCYIERNGRNIQGLAFDPITEMLFFTDTKERSINWISFKPGSENNVYGNLLIKMADGIPTDIAVDSCRGYIYWINLDLKDSTIERARFNGSEREVVIKARYILDIHSLAIDQQTQKIYWFMPDGLFTYLYSVDLSGRNTKNRVHYKYFRGDETIAELQSFVLQENYYKSKYPNRLTISKGSLYMVDWSPPNGSSRWVYILPKATIKTGDDNRFIQLLNTFSVVGIAAKYKISEQIQGVQACKAVTSLVPNNYMTDDSMHIPNNYYSVDIAREYAKPFCVHGIKVTGQPLCKCTPGYTGERCDVSICENYDCFQGICSFNEEGLPKCRCNAGYSGERCEINVCHGYCSNNGTCSLNEENEPVCQCTDDFAGARCQVSDCLNYCLHGDCSYDVGVPKCRCNAGYSGERCQVNVCHGYCLNNGTCSFNEENEPVCQCIDDYAGDRCQVSDCLNYCIHGDCSYDAEGVPKRRCNAGYSGERCEVNVCHGYCSNNGTCSLNEENEPVCQCIDEYAGDRCQVSDCLNYCLYGDCSYDVEGVPKCRCNAGYSGERCEVNVCHGYCSNNGTCSLNEENEPVCQCIDDYAGDRCQLSDCLNYCLHGDCSYDVEGVPKCRCNAGHSGERCEVNVCHGFCSNNGTCFLNEENDPVCQCIDDYAGDRCEVSDCLNYCLQGDCSFSEEEVPECRCNAGYSGERCEVNVCRGYCLNNGTCFLNEENDPVCQCIDDYAGARCDVSVCLDNGDCSLIEEGSRCKADKKTHLSTTTFTSPTTTPPPHITTTPPPHLSTTHM